MRPWERYFRSEGAKKDVTGARGGAQFGQVCELARLICREVYRERLWITGFLCDFACGRKYMYRYDSRLVDIWRCELYGRCNYKSSRIFDICP